MSNVLGPIHVGATSPTYYPLVTVTATGKDLSLVTSAVVRARKPGGDEVTWTGGQVSLPGPQTETSCPVQWTLADDDIDVPGAWRVEIDLFTPASATSPIFTHSIAMPVVARYG